jgi:hypothetical protein
VLFTGEMLAVVAYTGVSFSGVSTKCVHIISVCPPAYQIYV